MRRNFPFVSSSRERQPYRERVFDISVALLTLLLYWWLILLAAVLVATDETNGNVLYWQQRVGTEGEPFIMPKFRTMVPAENVLSDVSDEERITRTGRILRRTNLDELPQLWSVLRGE